MSNNNQFIQRTSNRLFEDDDDDIDDDTFLANSNSFHNGGGNAASAANNGTDAGGRLEQLHQQKAAVEQRSLESTRRTLGLLHDTEQVGMATAEELAKQREQLENTNKQLDLINTTLRSSQKHINGLKSVFGGLKNYLTGQRNNGAATASASAASAAGQTNGYDGAMEAKSPTRDTSYEAHPVARLRTDGDQQQFEGGASNTFAEQIDTNMDLMAGSLTRLKGLALNMHQEIESQNDLVDDISNKVEDVDVKIQRQNRDINKMLKK